jgi:hypothetical protein
MDHLAASIELAVFRDCAICLCSAKDFGSFACSPKPELSVQALGELYFGSVLDLALWIRSFVDKGQRKPNLADVDAQFRSLVNVHAVHCFPSLFAGNSAAHVGLLRLAARKLGLSDVLSSLSLDDGNRVQKLFVEGVELDTQMQGTPVITQNASAGFELSSVRLCVPQLHCLGESD